MFDRFEERVLQQQEAVVWQRVVAPFVPENDRSRLRSTTAAPLGASAVGWRRSGVEWGGEGREKRGPATQRAIHQ